MGSKLQTIIYHNQTDDINRSDMDMVTLPTAETYVVWNTETKANTRRPIQRQASRVPG